MFVNYVNGLVSVNSYRKPNAIVTTIADLIASTNSESNENLVASVSSDELAKNLEVLAFINKHADDSLDLPIEF